MAEKVKVWKSYGFDFSYDKKSSSDKKKLIIDEVYANEGPKLKRIRPRAQGRAYKILKPTCHITIVVKETS